MLAGTARAQEMESTAGSSVKRPFAHLGIIHGVVRDSASGQPLSGTHVQLLRAGRLIERTTTAELGRYTLHAADPGDYEIEVRALGFRPVRRSIALTGEEVTLDIAMASIPHTLAAVAVEAAAPVAVDISTGNQVFQQNTYHGAPAISTSQIVQQAVAGAARAPTGEVHIRGQHGEFTYYLDGLPIPPGISGSLSDVFSPAVVDRIEFQTGGWDAEFGNRNTAVINATTRVPAGGFHVEGAAYTGSFGTSGTSFMTSDNVGRLGIVLSGTRQVTDMWRDPVMQAKSTGKALNFHNTGEDQYAFGKLQYTAGERDLLTLDLNISRTSFQVPFDSTGGVLLDDRQHERNGFANVGWRHALGVDVSDGEVFVGIYHRESRLRYTPGANQEPPFVFYPDTVAYNVSEDRSARTTGFKLDALLPRMGVIQLKTGVDASLVRGHEHFATGDAGGRPGPSVDASVRGGDVGVYLQGSLQLSRRWELRPGLRYDVHTAPLAGSVTQLSPRLRLNFTPTPATSLWLYYGRLFVPSPVEDFHVLASAGQHGSIGTPTLPERDHFFEAGIAHRISPAGVTLKLDAYHKRSAPAVDDNTLPGTALTATVNVAAVRVTGIESVVEIRPAGAFSAYVNVALSHAYAHGPITGGFSPTAYPAGWYDLDHDQRLSIVGNLSYTRRTWYASATGIFGSGLTNGRPSAGRTELGLFDFNPAVKVAPNFIANTSVGGAFQAFDLTIRPQLFIDNVFDRKYVLKGAFTSGPAIGRPRTVSLRIDLAR
jgi:hypothetical protein